MASPAASVKSSTPSPSEKVSQCELISKLLLSVQEGMLGYGDFKSGI